MARVNVIGASGTGKSYWAGGLLEAVVPSFDIAVHFDIEDEEGGLCCPDSSGEPVYQTLVVSVEEAEKTDWTRLIGTKKKIRLVPDGFTVDERRRLYAVVCYSVMKICKELKPGWTGFVSLDEAHTLLGQANFDSRVERMITGGRKHGVECLHITQRPQLLHTTVISQADKRVYFGISNDNDIAKINNMSSFDARLVGDLPARCAIVENTRSGDYRCEYTDPEYKDKIPASITSKMDVVESNVNRRRPHNSGDDGLVDEVLAL